MVDIPGTAPYNLDSTHSTTRNSGHNGSPELVKNTSENLDVFSMRIQHFTWAWFCWPMSTGGLALLLSPVVQPHTFPGLNTIGKVVYIFDLVLFCTLTALITYRFTYHAGRSRSLFINTLTHPTESLFSATFLLSLASLIAGIARYGIPSCGPWLVVVYRILFWLYFVVTFIFAVAMYILLFTSPSLKIQDMTPAWDLPIFPFMLSGTIASSGAEFQPVSQAVPMIVGGLTAQGLGFLVSIMMYGIYIRRMVQFGFPAPAVRPAMFIAVGPPSFTALALLGMSNDWPVPYTDYFSAASEPHVTMEVLRILATVTACFIWSLSFWFFCISTVANVMGAKDMKFHLNWWAFVFPNVGFTIAIISIGKVFRSSAILWVGSVMTILMVILYLFVLVRTAVALYKRDVLWPGRDEDSYYTALHRDNRKMRAKAELGPSGMIDPEKHD